MSKSLHRLRWVALLVYCITFSTFSTMADVVSEKQTQPNKESSLQQTQETYLRSEALGEIKLSENEFGDLNKYETVGTRSTPLSKEKEESTAKTFEMIEKKGHGKLNGDKEYFYVLDVYTAFLSGSNLTMFSKRSSPKFDVSFGDCLKYKACQNGSLLDVVETQGKTVIGSALHNLKDAKISKVSVEMMPNNTISMRMTYEFPVAKLHISIPYFDFDDDVMVKGKEKDGTIQNMEYTAHVSFPCSEKSPFFGNRYEPTGRLSPLVIENGPEGSELLNMTKITNEVEKSLNFILARRIMSHHPDKIMDKTTLWMANGRVPTCSASLATPKNVARRRILTNCASNTSSPGSHHGIHTTTTTALEPSQSGIPTTTKTTALEPSQSGIPTTTTTTTSEPTQSEIPTTTAGDVALTQTQKLHNEVHNITSKEIKNNAVLSSWQTNCILIFLINMIMQWK